MGQNKAFLRVRGERIIDRTRRIFGELFDEVLLVTHSPLEYLDLNLRTVTDLYRGKGALAGVLTGVFYASHSRSFVAACDMPFLNPALIEHLVSFAPGFDVVVPRTEDGWQPLHAVYSKKCLPFMEELLAGGGLKIIDFYHRAKKREVPPEEMRPFDPELLSFLNLNTPEDLARLDNTAQP